MLNSFWEKFEGGPNFKADCHVLVPTIYGSQHYTVTAGEGDDALAVDYINRCGKIGRAHV